MFHVEKYGRKNFALYDGSVLVAVTAYKKGAVELKARFDDYAMYLAELERQLEEAKRLRATQLPLFQEAG